MQNGWPPQFETILRQYLPSLPADTEITEGLLLADNGLNSLGTVSLLVALEDGFDVVFPDELLAATMFDTPLALWQVLREVL